MYFITSYKFSVTDKIRITKELEASRHRRGIKFIEDDDRGNIIYSHRMEQGAFH